MKFRPQHSSKRRFSILYGKSFVSREVVSGMHLPVNQQNLQKHAGYLHYLACHAPLPIQKKWKKIAKKWHLRYSGDTTKQSSRYIMSKTSNKWW